MTALAGLRVIDFSRLLPGPYCTWLLADMGADVIRIENPRELAKQAHVFGWDRLTAEQRQRLRENDILARNKRSVMLDIGHERSREILLRMARGADVVVEDYRPGVLAGLGLGYEAMREVNPRLVYCSITLCGQTGPYRDKPGHDPVALSIAGVLSRVGEDPDAPSFPGIPAADVVTGTHAAFGILAALQARGRDGEGQHVDVAMSDCAMSLLVNVLSRHPDPRTLPPRGARRADIGLWRTRDGRFLCTTDMEPRYWRRFCEAVGRPEFSGLQNDLASRPRIRAELEAIFASRTLAEWLEILERAGTQFAPVYEPHEALEDPHNQARGMVQELAASNGERMRQVGQPVRLGRTPGSIRHPARGPGADAQAVLAELGYAEEEMKEVKASGALGEAAQRA